jgi:hypothetical protein
MAQVVLLLGEEAMWLTSPFGIFTHWVFEDGKSL